MICERCGTVFCCDDADQIFLIGPHRSRRRFCSETCKRKGGPRTCKICEADFLPEVRNQRYCPECMEISRARHIWGDALRQVRRLEQEREQEEERIRNGFCPRSGKVRHETKSLAQNAARYVTRTRYDAAPGWLQVYKCGLCYGWHLTSKPKKAPSRA